MNANIADSKRLDIIGNGDRSSAPEVLAATIKRWRQRLGYCSIFAAVSGIVSSNIPVARSDEPKKPEVSAVEPTPERLRRLNNGVSNRALLKQQSEFRLPHQKGNFAMLAALAGNDDCPGQAIPGGNYPLAAPFIASGDTTGANNTIKEIPSYYYYFYGNYSAHGPDHVYSFILTGHGPDAQIEVSTTSGTYKPLIYVVQGEPDGKCPAGTGNVADNMWTINDSRWHVNGTKTITLNIDWLPLNVPFHVFVDSAHNDAFGAGPYTLKMQDVTIAPAVTCSNPNSIDCAEFFVRQHYRDFLSREPDAPGLAHWTNEITKCSNPVNRSPGEAETQCVDRKRTDTSGAFYLSSEFQNSANFLIRINWGSLGKDRAPGRKCIVGQHSALDAVCRPSFSQYIADMVFLTEGIVVNNGLDHNRMNTNKRNFANQFVTRPEFLAAYPTTMTPAEYVDKLSQTTGIALTAQERSDLIAEAGTTGGRGLVLFKIVDGTTTIFGGHLQFDTRYGKAFYDQEFNPAFVFVEYLSYLRRNPDQAGYDHWLNKLNFHGNFVDAQMVRSFLVSDEYRSRF